MSCPVTSSAATRRNAIARGDEPLESPITSTHFRSPNGAALGIKREAAPCLAVRPLGLCDYAHALRYRCDAVLHLAIAGWALGPRTCNIIWNAKNYPLEIRPAVLAQSCSAESDWAIAADALHVERGVKVRHDFFLARVALGALKTTPRPGLCPPLIARDCSRACWTVDLILGCRSGIEPVRQAGLETGATYSGQPRLLAKNAGVVPRRRGSECLSPRPNLFFQIKNGLGNPRGAATSKSFFLPRGFSCAGRATLRRPPELGNGRDGHRDLRGRRGFSCNPSPCPTCPRGNQEPFTMGENTTGLSKFPPSVSSETSVATFLHDQPSPWQAPNLANRFCPQNSSAHFVARSRCKMRSSRPANRPKNSELSPKCRARTPFFEVIVRLVRGGKARGD